MRKFLSLFTVLMLVVALVSAQEKIVTGTVRDESGAPVPFATVTETGKKNGTIADGNGNFSIKTSGNSLSFSAAGFDPATATPQGNIADISLKRNNTELTTVVVTALGQRTSKAKVGYSTTTFNSEAINRTANVSAFDALAGKIAGAEISNTGGPGASTKVILRGYGVIAGGGNQPLYVIDGIPLSDARPGSPGQVAVANSDFSTIGLTTQNDFGNASSDINPNDIETITVLKGTAAASLYGSAAKNGAILITTKRGKAGKLHVDFAGSANFSKVGKLPTLQKVYGQGWNGTFVLGENGNWGPRLDGKMRPWGSIVDNSQLIKPFSFIEDNIRDFYNTGLELNNSIAISGGTDKSTFYFSYSNVESDGVIPTKADYLGRNTFSLRTNNKFGKFTINSSFNYVNRKVNQPATGQGSSSGSTIFQDILQIPSDIPIHDFRDYKNKFFDVNSYFTPFAENPYYGINENGNTQIANRFFGNLDLSYQLTNSLAAQFRVGADLENARTFSYNAVNGPDPGSWNAGGNTEGASRTKDVGSVTETNSYIGNINGDFILKYNKELGKSFNLEALAGANYYQADTKEVFASITNLLIPRFYNLSNSTKQPKTGDARSRKRLFGVYAQATLGFKNQLYLTLNARNDWSSTLPIDDNHFFYPGGNLSWVASNTFDFKHGISYLKFRAGYGKTGTSAPVYDIYPVLISGSVPIPFGSIDFPFNGVSSFRIQNTIANANLKPIITTEAELGMEIRFFNNRLGLDVAVYDKKTDGQIFNVPISPASGYTALVQNLGLVSNKGVEVSLDVKPVQSKNVTWTINYNFGKNWNKVENLTGGPEKITIFGVVGGVELDAFPGKTVSGIYAFGPQLTPDGKTIVSASTGRPLPTQDRIYFGNAENDYTMGLSSNLKYKEWQVNFSFDYRKGGVFYSKTAEQLLFTGGARPTLYNDRRPFIYPNSVIQTGVDAQGKPVYAENTTPINENDFQDFWPEGNNPALAYFNDILDRSFLKLRDVSLSYMLPHNLASKIKASNLTLTVYARNLLLWTPASNLYIDPEASNFGNDLTSQLGEFETAPISKQFGVALKASF